MTDDPTNERAAAEELLPLVYDELRALAGVLLRNEPSGHTLQPTALVGMPREIGGLESGLFEFAHLATGEVPERGPDGRLAIWARVTYRNLVKRDVGGNYIGVRPARAIED